MSAFDPAKRHFVIIELKDGFISAAANDCVTLTVEPAKALAFASEAEAADFTSANAPQVLAWAGWIKFCRCTSRSFMRVFEPQSRAPTHHSN